MVNSCNGMLKNHEKHFQMMFKDMRKCSFFSMNWEKIPESWDLKSLFPYNWPQYRYHILTFTVLFKRSMNDHFHKELLCQTWSPVLGRMIIRREQQQGNMGKNFNGQANFMRNSKGSSQKGVSHQGINE